MLRERLQVPIWILFKKRRAQTTEAEFKSDIMWQLMRSSYKDGTPVPDKEIANMMIALLMAGQHSSSSSISWIMLRLAARPDIMEELYQEQIEVLGADLPDLKYEDLSKLTLHQKHLEGNSPSPHSNPLYHAQSHDTNAHYGYGMISKGASSPYLPFGAGRHRCIGEQFANVQLITIMATVVRLFKFKNPDGSKDVIGTDYTSLFTRPLEPAVVAWERR
ncbi:hypothetical protein DID88_004309 [Monilinia fructigena]|uniref:Cytochrome P450 n=1 Tax=Monilinia fructigena TaxID=38457 RepID=A0A395ISU5_9HELO|nr:hypothetical protein DID88_004309 [Monilinia fructigena]